MGEQADDDQVDAPLRGQEVLGAAGIGVWRWNAPRDELELDQVCGQLLGVAESQHRLLNRQLRAVLHAEDFVQLQSTVQLAVSEQRVFESRVRVVTGDGRVLRVLLLQLVPGAPTGPYPVLGTAIEGQWAGHGPEDCQDRTAPPLLPEPAPATRPELPRPVVDGVTSGSLEAELAQIEGLNRAPASPARRSPVRSAPTADMRRSREAFLLDAGRALAEAGTTSEVLRVVATLSMPGFSPDGLAVFGVDGGMLTVVGEHGHPEADLAPFRMSLDADYPGAEVARTGRPVYLSSAEAYQRRYPGTWPLAEGFGRSSWAFLPLITGGRTTGTWMAAFHDRVRFTPEERAVLSTVARMLAHALERAHTNESERALSLGLRRSMAAGSPAVSGMTVASRYVPTGGGLMVGGDWYDVIDLPDGRFAVVIGDVQGHDVHAASLMAQLRTAVHAYAAEGHHPDAVLARTSRFLAALDDDRFATCVYIEADPARGTLAVARAGHPHPVLRMPDGTCLLRHVAGGLPLGLRWARC